MNINIYIEHPEETEPLMQAVREISRLRQARHETLMREHGSILSGQALGQTARQADRGGDPVTAVDVDEQDTPDPKPRGRVYGATSEGKARRTKEEMAIDKEIEELAEKLGIVELNKSIPADELLKSLLQYDLDEAKPAISASPEDRQPPEDEPEEEEKEPAREATRNDVVKAMQDFVAATSFDRAQSELPKIMGYKKQSEIPDDPAEFAKVEDKIRAAIEAENA